MPAGAALGWLAGRAWRQHALGRAAVIVLAPVIAGLTLLGFARPDLFPTTVLRRRALLERIGPPRVVTGAAAFASTPVADRSQWVMAAELDGLPGEELALVDHAGARVIDPRTLETRRTIAFPGTPRRLLDQLRGASPAAGRRDRGGGNGRRLLAHAGPAHRRLDAVGASAGRRLVADLARPGRPGRRRPRGVLRDVTPRRGWWRWSTPSARWPSTPPVPRSARSPRSRT